MVELADARRALRARWWFPVLGVLLGLAAAAVVLWRATPVYTSTTQVFVSATEVTDLPQAHAAELFAMQRLQSYAELLESERLARGVVEDLGLDETPAEVASRIRVEPIAETVVLTVTVTDSTADRAQALAAAVADEFTEQVATLERPPGVVEAAVQVAVIEPATHDPDPISPDPARDLSLGGGLGLLLGLLAVLLPRRVGRTVDSADDVRDATGSRPLTALVEDPAPTWGAVQKTLDPASPDAGALRTLRAHLQFGHGDSPPRVVVLTGVLAGEGRSALAARLALTLAQSGTRVALVQTDPETSDLGRTLALPGTAGLTDVLAGTADLDSALQQWDGAPLAVLTAGSSTLDISTSTATDGITALVGRLRDRAALVLVDAPPLSPVPEALALGEVADGFLLVSRFGVTLRDRLAEAAETLARTPAGLLGVVLTGVPRRAARFQRLQIPYAADRPVGTSAAPAVPPAVPSRDAARPGGPPRPAETVRRVGPLPAVSPEPS
ncbi:Wzz/FepE/Etk N-terminal domain-containing protein [Geodermatophilus sp. SYSU D01180]